MCISLDLPDLSGKTVAVTGATGGLGLEASRMLAGAGARVILIGRDAEKAATALDTIARTRPAGAVEFLRVDFADLANVAAGAHQLQGMTDRLDVLVNNAGLMAPSKRKTTKDGFEAQFGTNHLAHFALTGHLLPLLRHSQARVVSVASLAAIFGRIDFSDLQAERRYDDMRVYAQSKLANLLFTNELARRSRARGWGITALAAHPGLSRTSLFRKSPDELGFADRVGRVFSPLFSQSAADGALPLVLAATDKNAQSGDYYGPTNWFGMNGPPKKVGQPRGAGDIDVAKRLWEVSENLGGVHYPSDGASIQSH